MVDNERPELFTEADFERRKAIPTWACVIAHGCICEWEPDADMWKMVKRKRHCIYHGVNGVL